MLIKAGIFYNVQQTQIKIDWIALNGERLIPLLPDKLVSGWIKRSPAESDISYWPGQCSTQAGPCS